MSRILVTGGAGYIGSHTSVELLRAGHDIVVLDNLCNARKESLRRVTELTGRDFPFVEADVRDRAALDALFRAHEHRRGHPLRRPEGGGRVRRQAPSLLGQQRLRDRDSPRGDGRGRSEDDGLQLLRNGLRRPRERPDPGGLPHRRADESLRAEQARRRAGPDGPRERRSPPGGSRCCATSTPSEPTRADASARTPAASRTTSCPSSRRSPSAAATPSTSSATTTRPPTAPGCGTTSTSWTSRRGT